MKFDFKNLNPGVWFEYEDKSFSVEVRICAGQDLERIFKATQKTRVEYKRDSRFEYLDIDHDKRDEMMWDFIIIDWKGIEDGAGKPLPCTTENKVALMKGSVLFTNFIGECVELLSSDIKKIKVGKEKNLSSSA
jgi:hypothetical protein